MTAIIKSRLGITKAIILTGLLAGCLDILVALADYYIQTGKGPENVLRYIASGVFGMGAFEGDAIMIWLGLVFHFLIAYMITIIFFLLYPKLKLLHSNFILTAVLIGLVVWFLMNIIVVPLSNVPKSSFNINTQIKAAIILTFTIGLPLSLSMKNYFKK